jgi:hypothetical protein
VKRGFDPLAVLTTAHRDGPTVAWLDLCCGTARALIQAADRVIAPRPAPMIR